MIRVFFPSNKVILGGLLDSFKRRLVTRETKPELEAWKFQSHLPTPRVGEEELHIEVIINHAYVIRP